ncbi:MAG: penicillin-binding protein 2 [bacterium]|nr:penicillin-binding protein 2 [bacterium]
MQNRSDRDPSGTEFSGRTSASNGMKMRFFLVLVFFVALYTPLVFNIYTIQIRKSDYYTDRALSQHIAGSLEPQRGSIYFTDRNGNPIPAAITKGYPAIFAVPEKIKNPEAVAQALEEFLTLDHEKLMASLNKSDDPYELLVRRASAQAVQEVAKRKLPGIYTQEEYARFYPFKSLASQVIGFVGENAEDARQSGKYGLELFYEDSLFGKFGVLESDTLVNPIAGQNIFLTIDSNIQTRAEEVLDVLVEKYHGSGGSVIVQDPHTGAILAMGGNPDFDPNAFGDYELKDFINPTIQGIYEPGSVMKVITMASALDAKKLTPDTTFYDSGALTLNDHTIRNWDLKAHGKITMTEVIEQSINTGAAHAQRLLGNDLFYNYLVKFGFGTKTGIALPGELSGSIQNLKTSFRAINFATAAFGQGISVTPLQLISAVSAIANGGTLLKPYVRSDESPTIVRRVISEEASDLIVGMMTSAVKKAVIAQIQNFEIAGKTGTAQIPDFRNGGYSDDFIHTFVGFAPAQNPRFTILIRLDKPAGAPLAGTTVVPAFRELAEYLVNYYNIPPDTLE